MGSIILLDENTINKIAAGEVVDRPASIVKELVENSIDANAKNITVEIKNGGISYVRISDDGDGFKSDDVEIAFERHATSKIRKEADILKITSMGFRGEALASIAAISKVLLITRNKDEQVGTRINIESGNILAKENAASNKGTTIYIKDVFFNTPARFKFLKKDFTEAGYIEDVIIRIALANPQISFKYINNGKEIINTNGDNKLESVVYSIFGKEVYSNLLTVNYVLNDIKVSGVAGLPQISRSNRNNEYTYINSRYVKDNILRTSIEKAYNEKLGINKFPFAIINVEMSPEIIDVNVHPAKLEVKFENEKQVFDAVYYALQDSLEMHNRKNSPFTIVEKPLEINANNNNNNFRSFTNITEDFKTLDIQKFDFKTNEAENLAIDQLNNFETVNLINHLNIKEEKEEQKYNAFETYIKDEIKFQEEEEKIIYKYIGNIFDTYIIIEIKEKMYIIDQHAAHERLLYEEFKNTYYSKTKETQILMIPVIIELKNNEFENVIQNISFFENAGFILEPFSNSSIKISGVPNIADFHIEDKTIFLDLLDEIMGNSKTEFKEKEFRFLATLACKAAVKGNMNLSRDESINLLDNMLKLDNPFTCPHGRPTAYEITKYEIERRFGRK